ncbi:MAG TPA: flagellar biosynthetic protein FliO [Deltaproteobacteria bacterium]|jgi:flagellar biosynthetic protein FliO|nr:flagellar biosynthetic protein FliO [Deltaproteobacteria bacterium]HQJ09213.1 flagellar biosynthetic protein FliO [Deltaproteobacteria bacterium]
MRRLKPVLPCIAFLLVTESWASAAAGDMTAGSVKPFVVLIGTIAALFALAWAARKYGPYSKVKKALGLDILGQMPVGAKAHLALVRVGKSILLLGVTQNHVSLIKDLKAGDFEETIQGIDKQEGEI